MNHLAKLILSICVLLCHTSTYAAYGVKYDDKMSHNNNNNDDYYYTQQTPLADYDMTSPQANLAESMSEESLITQLNTYLLTYEQVLVNTKLHVECPLYVKDRSLSKFRFRETLFLKSIHGLDLAEFYAQFRTKSVTTHVVEKRLYFRVKSKFVFRSLFKELRANAKSMEKWSERAVVRNSTRFAQSGLYYCVYSYKNEYLISGKLYLVYEGKWS